MMRPHLVVVTMTGADYACYERDGAPSFPEGELRDGEALGDGARRLVSEWTGTSLPKLELLDVLSRPGELTFILRAMLIEAPKGDAKKWPRMGLPPKVGRLDGKYVEEAIKTSLVYKLTRV